MRTQQTTSTKKKYVKATKLGHGKKGPTKLSKAATTPLSQQINVQNRIRSTFTGTRAFDRSLHKTNTWLKEMMDLMNWNNREKALSALRATLHALRDILPLQENIHLSAQMPILIRGLYFENWHYHPEPLRMNTIGEFYELVREKLGRGVGRFSSDELRRFTRASLFVMTKHISAGELYDIKGLLRRHLRDLISVSFDELEEMSHTEGSFRRRQTTRNARKKLAHAKQSRQRRVELSNLERQGQLH